MVVLRVPSESIIIADLAALGARLILQRGSKTVCETAESTEAADVSRKHALVAVIQHVQVNLNE